VGLLESFGGLIYFFHFSDARGEGRIHWARVGLVLSKPQHCWRMQGWQQLMKAVGVVTEVDEPVAIVNLQVHLIEHAKPRKPEISTPA